MDFKTGRHWSRQSRPEAVGGKIKKNQLVRLKLLKKLKDPSNRLWQNELGSSVSQDGRTQSEHHPQTFPLLTPILPLSKQGPRKKLNRVSSSAFVGSRCREVQLPPGS